MIDPENPNDSEQPLTLKAYREKVMQCSQEELARRANVSSRSVYEVESGRQVPKADTAGKMASALGVSLKRFYRMIGLDVSGIPDD